MTTTSPCRCCGTPKPPRMYLCGGCWDQLPVGTRRALNQRDSRAYTRLRALHAHIDSGYPLTKLEITR